MAFAAALAATSVTAQQDTVTLTLADALRIAEESNPAYRRAVNDVSLNSAQMRTTWLNELLPSASLNLFRTNFNGNLQRIAQDNFGNPIDNPTADWVYFSGTTQSLSLNWAVQGASLFQAYRRQSLTNRSRDVAESGVRTDVSVNVRRLYWDALEQLDLTRTEGELVDARRVDLELTERLFGLAQRTRVDVLNAELAVEQQALALQQQRAGLERARLALRTELGDESLGPLRLGGEDLPLFDPAGLDADRLVAQALDMNPQIRQSRVEVASATLGLQEQRNAWWPEVGLGVQFFRRSQTSGSEALFDPSPGSGLEGAFNLSLSVPMFSNYAQNRQLQYEASVELDNSRQSERETRLAVEEDVRTQLLELRNQWESLRLTERARVIAEEALELRREEYRLGTASFEQLRDTIEQEADARRNLITARHAFVDALLNLEAAVGTEVRD